MCFVASSNHKELIAKKDIICYKVMGSRIYKRHWYSFWKKQLIGFYSLFQRYRYIVNTCNEPVILFPHKCENSIIIHRGYHSYIAPSKYFVKCIIPKGSAYYKNDYEYVSSNIIVTDEIVE